MFQSDDLQKIIKKQKRSAEENDAKRRAERLGLPYLDPLSAKIPTELKAIQLVPEKVSKKALVVPLQILGKKLVVASFNPELEETKEIIKNLQKQHEVVPYVCSKTGLEHVWTYYEFVSDPKKISGSVETDEEKINALKEKIKTAKDLTDAIAGFKGGFTSQVLELVLGGALAMKASDIHLEPGSEKKLLRLRIDGLLHTIYDGFSDAAYKSIITRIKLLSELKLNVHDEPQDGRFTINMKDRDIEARTSVIPSEYGETVVLRLLDPLSLKVELEVLGWREDDLEIIRKKIKNPNGLILNTGPTGSGKTTTLYAFLKHIKSPEIKIITIEDPIEYHLEGISQTQVDIEANYTFASGLRSILRQDPDIVLVGEIRDQETAEIALNASLTGHLVFSTLHTNDAVGAIPRLIDLHAKPQILGPALSLVIAQRLIRVLCPKCKRAVNLEKSAEEKIRKFLDGLPDRVKKSEYNKFTIQKPVGCKECNGIGYKGRTSIFELFVVSEEIEKVVYGNPTEIDLFETARKEGMVLLQEDGILKALKGITSLNEVERLTGEIRWISTTELEK